MVARSEAELQRGAVGLTEVLFQSITHMAPAVAVALSIGAATAFAGGQTPLAVVFALIASLFTAYSIGELAWHLPSAGGMYTYGSISRTCIGRPAGSPIDSPEGARPTRRSRAGSTRSRGSSACRRSR